MALKSFAILLLIAIGWANAIKTGQQIARARLEGGPKWRAGDGPRQLNLIRLAVSAVPFLIAACLVLVN